MSIANIKTIGIVGAGTMGQGIAQVCATSKYDVLIYDINEAQINKAIQAIEESLAVTVEKGKISSEAMKKALSRIKPQPDLKKLKADLIIEAAVEDLKIKQEIFSILEKVNRKDCILTTNTSSIQITQIGSVLKNPKQFAGFHFFNPAHIMKLVEIISGTSTSEKTVETLKVLAEKFGKVAVLAKDSPGFIVNRIARNFYVEALQLLEENVADIKTIDTLIRASGFRMGPFELMDLIGVDTNFSVTTSMYNAFHQNPKFRPNRVQQLKVAAGHLGRKSGKGFYEY